MSAREDLQDAFELVIEIMDKIIKEIRKKGADALESGNYTEAMEAIDRTRKLEHLEDEIMQLKGRLFYLLENERPSNVSVTGFSPVGEKSDVRAYGGRTLNKDTESVEKQKKSSMRTYAADLPRPRKLHSIVGHLWLLAQAGGPTRPRQIFDALEASGELTKKDREKDPGGMIRYQHVVHGNLQKYKREGWARRIDHGIWEITEEGLRYLRERLKQEK